MTRRGRHRWSGPPDVPTDLRRREDPGVLALALRLAGLVLVALLVVGAPSPAGAQEADDPSPTTLRPAEGDLPLGDIIPRPNSGRAPDSPNDPGGWQQYLVLGLVLAGLATIFGLAVRESRRARARRGSRSPAA